jgi:hypothetical protein
MVLSASTLLYVANHPPSSLFESLFQLFLHFILFHKFFLVIFQNPNLLGINFKQFGLDF